MANTIEKAAVYQKELDEQLIAEAVTGWMDANTNMAKYSGGAEIKIPKIVMDGLGDYDRNEGYPTGSVTVAYQTMTMTQDRAQGFNLDAMDVEESGLDGLAGLVMSEFQRMHVIPEVDSYRLSALYKLAVAANRVSAAYTPAASTILGKIKADITAVKDQIGANVPLVMHISTPAAALLDNETLSRQLGAVDFKAGDLTLKVKAVDDVPLLRTPSDRMKTAYTFHSGETKFGYEAAADAKQINWIIMARSAPIAPCKTDTIRIFDPTTYQKANAWHIDYRKYHDLWVPENKLPTLYANAQS